MVEASFRRGFHQYLYMASFDALFTERFIEMRALYYDANDE